MFTLEKSLRAWGTPKFEAALKEELEKNREHLPLQQGLAASSSVVDAPITVLILNAAELETSIRVKAGIFYQGIDSGCSCVNDPTPESENTEYCEVQVEIEKGSGAASVRLLGDD